MGFRESEASHQLNAHSYLLMKKGQALKRRLYGDVPSFPVE